MENNIKLNVICTEHPDNELIISRDNNVLPDGTHDWTQYLGSIYLHGDVEIANKFDCVDLINSKQLLEDNYISINKITDSTGKTVSMPNIPNGIYDCHVYGYPYECKAYIWHGFNNRNVGLIVDINDVESVLDATKKYSEHKPFV